MARRPSWLDEQIAGLDAGAGYAAAAHLGAQRDGSPGLLAAGLADFDPESAERDQARALRALWREAGIRTCTVAATLRSPSMLLKFFRYDGLDEQELASTLRLEAEASLHADPRDLLIDWQVTGRSTAAGRARLEGVLLAAPRAPVEKLQRVLRRAGLYPVVLDSACLALANLAAVLQPERCAKETIAVVHVCEQCADLVILGQGGDVYPRHVLARAPTWDETARYIVGSIEDNLKYYTFKLRERAVDRVLFTGTLPGGPEFLTLFAAGASVLADRWNPLLEMAPLHRSTARQVELLGERGSLLAPAIGQALRGLPS